jgi:hypothetical protein
MAIASTRSLLERIEVTNPFAPMRPVRPVLQERGKGGACERRERPEKRDRVKGEEREERPVDVIDWVQREIEEDDVADVGYVDASRCDVSADEILSRGVVAEELQIRSSVVRI